MYTTTQKVFETSLEIDVYMYDTRVTYYHTPEVKDVTILSVEVWNEEEQWVALPYLGRLFAILEQEIGSSLAEVRVNGFEEK